MNTYLLPISDGSDCWIEHVVAKGVVEAEEKFVKNLADDYEFIDYGDDFKNMQAVMLDNGFTVGDVYDIEEF